MNGSPDASLRSHLIGMGHCGGAVRYRRILLFLIVVLTLSGGWAYWLWRSEPVYWQQRRSFFEQHTPEERMALAESVEQRILATLSDVSIAAASESEEAVDENTVFLTMDEINAWIDQRLYDWAANQGSTIPDFITDPMLAIDNGDLVIAFLYDSPSMPQVFGIQCDVVLKDDQAMIKVIGVSGGRLQIPAAQAASRVVGRVQGQESKVARMTDQITEAFDGMVFDPILKLGQQKVLLKAFELEPDGARLVFEPYSPPTTYAQDTQDN